LVSTLLQQKLGRMSSGSGPKQGDDTAFTERTHTYRFRIATSTPIVRELTGRALADHSRLWQPGDP
jgi:hypothetical protein